MDLTWVEAFAAQWAADRKARDVRASWSRGLEHLPDLHVTVEGVRVSVDTVVIDYRSEHDAGTRNCRLGLTILHCGVE